MSRIRVAVVAYAALAGCASVYGQFSAQPPIPIRDMPVADLTGGIVVWLDVPGNTREGMQLTIPTEHHKDLVVQLQPNTVLAENFELREYTTLTEYRLAERPEDTTYTGTVAGVEGSRVAMSILPEGLLGAIFLPDGSTVWVQPLSEYLPGAPPEMHVVYAGEDSSCGGFCDTPMKPRPDGHGQGGYDPRGQCGGTYCEALVACEADFLYYQARGNSSTVTTSRITAIINVVNHQYQRDVAITHAVGAIIVRTTAAADPYSSNDSATLLGQLRGHWNAILFSVPRDTVHLFTGREIDSNVIGRAYVGVVCDTMDAYGFSQSDFSTNFSCVTDLTAHELGHNWDANHCTCTSSTMNPSITCVNTFQNSTTPNSITDINAYENSVTCLTPRNSIPANNMCTSATRITRNGQWTGSNVGATTDGGYAGCGSNGAGTGDVWWVLTPPASGTVTIDTCGSDFDTILSVFDDCPGGIDDLVACNDDMGSTACPSNGNNSRVTFTGTQGATYYIRVTGFGTASGNIVLNVNAPLLTNNSPCASATIISHGDNLIGSLYNAVQDGEATCGSSNANPDVWYRFTAPCNGTLVVDTCGSHDWAGNTDTGVDTVLSLHTACVGNTTNQITCNDDSTIAGCTQNGSVRDSRVSAVVTRGDIVRIRVAHFGINGFNNGMFRIRAFFTESTEAPIVNTIANAAQNCGSPYIGPTPSLVAPGCMTPVTWSLPIGPPGMTINASTGVVTWPTPIAGVHTISIRASNSAGFDDETWTLTINRLAPVVNPISNASITCGTSYTGPTPTLTNPTCMNPITSWTLVTAPAGMTINASTGVVSWTTPAVGSHTITIRATNSAGFDDETWTLTVNQAPPVLNDIPDATVACAPYTGPTPTFTNPACMAPATLYQLAAGAPAGMTINSATGVVSWPNPVAGSFPITIRVTTNAGSDTESWTLTVTRSAPVIVDIPNATHNLPAPYVGPTPSLTNPRCMNPVSYSLVTFPAGMTINNTTGVVTWASPVLGSHNIVIRATNSAGFDDEAWRIDILPGTPCDPDVNCDGNVDQDDVACLSQAVAGNPSCLCVDPDFNGDGNVDQDDINALSQVVAGAPCP